MDENERRERTLHARVDHPEHGARRLFYAWVGATATAYDAAEDTFDGFVRRGQEVTEEWRERGDDVSMQAVGTRARMRDSFGMMVDSLRSTMNLPTKSEIDAMNVKLNILMRKLDDLAMDREGVSRPGRPEAPPMPAVTPTDTDLAT